ncbi:MAG: serine hydrolase, partial [Gammaproteobacteria bacterium]
MLAGFMLGTAAGSAGAPPAELPGRPEFPPGDPVELEMAGFAKLLCTSLFVVGRDLRAAIDEDGAFVEPPAARRAAEQAVVDRQRQSVSLRLPGGVTRTARRYGDQGCVILPRGQDRVFFDPLPVRPAPATALAQPWPDGDGLPTQPLSESVDAGKLARAVELAFAPPEALTAAFVVAHRGRIV